MVNESVVACSLDDGDEDADKFVCFLSEVSKARRWEQVGIVNVPKPKRRFVELLEAVSHFGDKLRFGAATVRFAVICPHRGSRTQKLESKMLSQLGRGKGFEKMDNTAAILVGSLW